MDKTEGWIEITIKTTYNTATLYEFVEYEVYDLEDMEIGESTIGGSDDLRDLIFYKGHRNGIIAGEFQAFTYSVKIIEYPPEEELNSMISNAEYKIEKENNKLEWLKIQLMLARKNAKETEW